MREIHNGMPATELDGVAWQKSRRSNSQGNCVEIAALPDGGAAVRNSRHPDGPALAMPRARARARLGRRQSYGSPA